MKWLRLFLFYNIMASNADDTICTICLSPIYDSSISLQLNCAHIFHASCIRPWIDEHQSCPICRTPLVTVDQEAQQELEQLQQEQLRRELEQLQRELELMQRELEQTRREREQANQELEQTRREREQANQELELVRRKQRELKQVQRELEQ